MRRESAEEVTVSFAATNWVSWSVQAKESLLANRKLKFIEYLTFNDYSAVRIISDHETRYNNSLLAINNRPLAENYTEANRANDRLAPCAVRRRCAPWLTYEMLAR